VFLLCCVCLPLPSRSHCATLSRPWQDFLNGVCTHIIWLTKNKLTYYTGNYDTFCKTVAENEVIQHKKYEKEQDDIKHIKQFIASCGTFLTFGDLRFLLLRTERELFAVAPQRCIRRKQTVLPLHCVAYDSAHVQLHRYANGANAVQGSTTGGCAPHARQHDA